MVIDELSGLPSLPRNFRPATATVAAFQHRGRGLDRREQEFCAKPQSGAWRVDYRKPLLPIQPIKPQQHGHKDNVKKTRNCLTVDLWMNAGDQERQFHGLTYNFGRQKSDE